MSLPFELPYQCDDPACTCRDEYPTGSGAYVRVRIGTGRAHEASVIEDGIVQDVFHDHDLGELLRAVHREYPGAETHTPFRGKVARSARKDYGA